jgi:hypothetical protein
MGPIYRGLDDTRGGKRRSAEGVMMAARQTRVALRTIAPTGLVSSINEPQADWVPIGKALYYCANRRFDTSSESWTSNVLAEAQDIMSKLHHGHPPPKVAMIPEPEWFFATEQQEVSIYTRGEPVGVTTVIAPGNIRVFNDHLVEGNEEAAWSIDFIWYFSLRNIFNHAFWSEVSKTDRTIADCHKQLLETLVGSWRAQFCSAVRSGEALIMARKHLLEPFELIAWDQWQFFSLDEPSQRKWGEIDLRDPYYLRDMPATATAPNGDRLYSIYVAPGIRPHKANETQEQKCHQWLIALMRNSPTQPPQPLNNLAETAVSMFPGLTKNGFFRCYSSVREQTGNNSWSNPGRPRKSPQKSRQKK